MSYSTVSCVPVCDPSAVFVRIAHEEVPCYWCNKMIQACDGQRTLAQVGELLHLPLNVCLKLMGRAQQHGWVTSSAAGLNSSGTSLWSALLTALGQEHEPLLAQAALMCRCQPGLIPAPEQVNFLIAVELLLPAPQRDPFVPRLDQLRQQYST